MKPTITKSKTTSTNNSPVHEVYLWPTAEIHLLIGSKYGKGNSESPYGHTAVYVKVQGKEYVYDFGRYGQIVPEQFGLITLDGPSSPRGEGILQVWNNFNDYIADENQLGQKSGVTRTTYDYGYQVYDHQAFKVIDFYNTLIKTTKESKKTKRFGWYRLAEDYFALGPNCTTQSLAAVKTAIPNITKGSEKYINPDKVLPNMAKMAFKASKYTTPNYLFLPDNLRDYLEALPAIRADIKRSYHAN